MRPTPWAATQSLALALCALAAGCQCQKAGPERTVEIARFRTLISAAGREDVPFDLEQAELSAIVADDGGARVIYPTVDGAGAATFHGMPDGGFVLTLAGYNLVTDQDRIDLGLVSLGRSSARLTDGNGTLLQLDVTGLAPWQPYSDVLQLTAENAGYVALNAQSYVGDQPDAGATAAPFPVRYFDACSTQRGQQAPLVEADAGDVATLTQLQSAPVGDAGTLELRTLVRAATLPAFTMEDGRTTAVAAALQPVAAQEQLTLDYRQSAFFAQASAVHPMAVPISSTATVTVLPYTADEGFFSAAPDLAVLRPQELMGDVALTFSTGNPFPASWAKVVSVRYALSVDVQFPDGGSRAITTALVTQALWSASMGPLAPRVTPPRQPKVDGADALVRAQISRVPRLTWEPPAVGSPTSYGVTIFRFSRVGGGPIVTFAEEAFFETTARELKLPFGEVNPGGEYVFGITAIEAPGTDVTRRPFKGTFPFGAATVLTALHRVDPTLMPP